ncbi:pitrilysin family protein [Flavobacterium sp.]|uniref:M16 family metallopeptidase n=1 Tax=Flavobacterium sp. TaxID=239 RepID=UPI0022BFB12E|nr:pitrilysin family protein [Flavobacterium sp.]MCZ8230107.1 pitrilysin family protein [Flavobacterium sp.]
MKNISILLTLFFVTGIMQAQNRPQPKPGPSPMVQIKKPESFVLKNGLKVMVVENHKLPRVSFNLTLDNPPFAEGNKKGVDDLTSSLVGNGSQKTPKDVFNEEIDFLGANINFSSQGASASALSKYSGRVLELLAEGALFPLFTQEEFDKDKAKMIEGLKANEKSVAAISSRVVDVLAFGKNHPSGEYVSEETLKNVTLADVQSNYAARFVPENAYLVIIGDVKFKETKAAVEKLFGAWEKKTITKESYTANPNVDKLQINLVDVPNAVQSEISLVNTLNLKMNDPDFFPAVIANQILGGDFNSYLNMNLREKHAWTYGARSEIGSGKYVTKFVATSAVRNAVTDSAVVEFIKEIKKIRTEKVDAEVLKNVKAGYIGRFVMQVQKPQAVARYALNIETEQLPADFYEKYIQTINAVTPEDILRVANKYFLLDNTRIVIVGKASEVTPGLEKLKLPLFFFDKYGNPVEKPVTKKEIPAGVTAKSVLENYIKAIGGKEALKKVKSIVTIASGSVQGTTVEMTSKITSDKKLSVEMKAGGMTMMKRVLGDKSGYAIQQGQRKDLSNEEFKEKKADMNPFDELPLLDKASITLAGIESINDTDAYAIKDGQSTLYYDTVNFFKIAESKTSERGTQTTFFNDYKEVKGIKFPHTTIMNIGIELKLTTSEVKINEGVTDADFQ